MKKRILSMLLVIVMVLALVPVQALAEEPGVMGTPLTLEVSQAKGKTTVKVGGNFNLYAKLSDKDKSIPDDLTWSASPEGLVNLIPLKDGGCKVQGLKEGNVTITAKANDLSKDYPMQVAGFVTTQTATPEPEPASDKLTFSPASVTLEGLQAGEVTAIAPTGESAEKITWDIAGDACAITEAAGASCKLIGKKVGSAVLTATLTKNDGTQISGTVDVTVNEVKAKSLTITKKTDEMVVGSTFTFKAELLPENTTDTVVWSSEMVPSETELHAEVKPKTGKVTAVSAGKAEIKASCGELFDTAVVTIPRTTEIVLDSKLPEAVLAGDKVVLKAELVNASTGEKQDAQISWKLAKETDAYYASVTNGTLNTKSDLLDQFTIGVVATVDSEKYDAEPVTYTVNVIPRASAITLTVDGKKVNDKETILNLEEKGSSVTIQSSISPSKAGQSVTWELTGGAGIYTKSEGTNTLTLTPNGTNKAGDIKVTAVAVDGTKVSATTTIRFEKQGTGIQFSESDIQLRGGASVNLSNYLELGENGNSSAVTWKFADGKTVYKDGSKQIATLSKTGKLTTKPVTKFTELEVIATNTVSGNSDTLTVNLYPATKTITITGAPKTIKYQDGLTYPLSATVKPVEAAVWDLKWSSSDKTIADVDPDSGELTILDAGKVRIECKTTDGSNVKGYLYLEITKNAKSVKITAPANSLASGKSMNLTANVMAPNGVKAANQKVTWSVTDEYGNETKAATVFPTGRVTAGDVDQSTVVVVTATSVADPEVSGTIKLTIKPNTTKTLHVKAGTDLVNGTYTMDRDDFRVLKGVWLRSNKDATETEAKDCQFFSSNESVATVEDGELTAVGYGTSTITARCTDPQTGNVFTTTFTVRVMKTVKDVTISVPNDRKYLRTGESLGLSATAWTYYGKGVNDVKAENQGFDWEVKEVVAGTSGEILKETDIASINANGVLTAGKVTDKHEIEVKAISKENGVSAAVRLAVYPKNETKVIFKLDNVEYEGVMPVDLDRTISSGTGSSATTIPDVNLKGLKVYVRTALEKSGTITVSEDEVTTSTMKWYSSNDKVIKVDKEKTLNLVGTGSTKLTAKGSKKVGTETVNFEASITVNVNRAVGSVTIEEPGVLASGKSINMRVNVANADATNKNVLWSVDSTEYATINRYTGKLSAKRGIDSVKKVVVTATPVDGSKADKKTVTIYPLTTKVEIKQGAKVINGTTVEAKLSGSVPSFKASASPAGAYEKSFKWTSSNKSVAEIDPETGAVTIKGVGKTTIKATALDGSGKYAKFTLRITK